MRILTLAACLFVLLITTVSGASEPAEKPQPDPRLDQKVTAKAVGKPLGDFLKEISAQTGVKFNARKDAADIKVAVFVKDTPLSSLKDALKDCLHLMCTREGKKGEWTYQFWEDLKTEQGPDRFKQAEIKRFQAYLDGLTKQIAEMESEGIDPAALVKELKSGVRSDMARWLASPSRELFGRFNALGQLSNGSSLPVMVLYADLSQEQMQTLWQGQGITVQMDGLGPDLQAKLTYLTAPYMDEGSSLADITFGIQVQNLKPSLNYMLNYAVPEAGDGNRKPLVGSGGSIDIPADARQKEADELLVLDVRAPKDSKKPVALEVKEGMNPYEVLEIIHDKGGVCMVSDFYTRLTDTTSFRISSGRRFDTWEQAAKFLAVKAGSDFNQIGNIWGFSNKTWPALRLREIPESLMAGWRRAKEQYEGMRIQEATELAKLNSMQLEDLPLYKIGNGGTIVSCQSALKLAGTLSTGQWQQAMTDQGLSLFGLTTDQLDMAQAWAREHEELAPDQSSKFSDREELRGYTLKILQEAKDGKAEDTKLFWGFILNNSSDQSTSQAAAKPVAASMIALDRLNRVPSGQ